MSKKAPKGVPMKKKNNKVEKEEIKPTKPQANKAVKKTQQIKPTFREKKAQAKAIKNAMKPGIFETNFSDDDEEESDNIDDKLSSLLSEQQKDRDEKYENYMHDVMTGKEHDDEDEDDEDEDEEDIEAGVEEEDQEDEDDEGDIYEDEVDIPEIDPEVYMNPFLECYKQWMAQAPKDMAKIFSPEISDDRRAELMDLLPSKAQRKYAWAIPDERAIRLLYNYAPVVEIGAGKGYWGYLLRKYTAAVNAAIKKGETLPFAHRKELTSKSVYNGYDWKPYPMKNETLEELESQLASKLSQSIAVKKSQKPVSKKNYREDDFPAWDKIEKGGVEKISRHPNSALFLCYPDDFEYNSKSMAYDCFKKFKGDTIITVGEAFAQTGAENPWGRSADADFQLHLAATFHKIAQVPLPNWPGTIDTLCVWKRTEISKIDDLQFKYIPPNETIHLLQTSPATAAITNVKNTFMSGPIPKPESKKRKADTIDEEGEAKSVAKKMKPADLLVAKMEEKEKVKNKKEKEKKTVSNPEYDFEEEEVAKPKIPLSKRIAKTIIAKKKK